MKRTVWKTRRDKIRQRYHVGRKRKAYQNTLLGDGYIKLVGDEMIPMNWDDTPKSVTLNKRLGMRRRKVQSPVYYTSRGKVERFPVMDGSKISTITKEKSGNTSTFTTSPTFFGNLLYNLKKQGRTTVTGKELYKHINEHYSGKQKIAETGFLQAWLQKQHEQGTAKGKWSPKPIQPNDVIDLKTMTLKLPKPAVDIMTKNVTKNVKLLQNTRDKMEELSNNAKARGDVKSARIYSRIADRISNNIEKNSNLIRVSKMNLVKRGIPDYIPKKNIGFKEIKTPYNEEEIRSVSRRKRKSRMNRDGDDGNEGYGPMGGEVE